jgi:hypothetical protein
MQPARRTPVTVSPGRMLKIRPAREGESWGWARHTPIISRASQPRSKALSTTLARKRLSKALAARSQRSAGKNGSSPDQR